MAEKESYLDFPIPDGWDAFDGVKDDEEVDMVATIRKKKGGKLCLVAIEGVPVGKAKEPTPPTDEPNPNEDRVDRLQQRFRPEQYPA